MLQKKINTIYVLRHLRSNYQNRPIWAISAFFCTFLSFSFRFDDVKNGLTFFRKNNFSGISKVFC
jgi:hypothetical protein